MKKLSMLLMLLAQCLFAGAQQVAVDHTRGGIGVAASAAGGVATVEAPAQSRAPKRVLSSTERGVGYAVGDSITTEGAYVGEAGSYDVAALLTNQTLANYKGCKVVGVRFALSQSIGKSAIFIYKVDSQGNAELVVDNSVRRTSAGWNDVRLNSSQEITLDGTEQLIMGFTYNESDEMAAGKMGALCFYGDQMSSSYSSLLLQGDTFNPISGLGDLCVQLIVDVSSLPRKQVSLNSILNGTSYKRIGESMETMMSYTNSGLETINALTIGYRVDNGEASYANVELKDGLAPGASATIAQVIGMPAGITAGRHALNVFVDRIDGETPVASERGKLADPFVAYAGGFQRQKSYLEQYNSQRSYLSPFVNDEYARLAKNGDVYAVNIYQQGEPLALDESLYLNDLYAYTYPCCTANRFFFGMGERHYAFDANDFATFDPSYVYEGYSIFVNEAKSMPSFATVDISTSYNAATRELGVDVSGDIADEADAIFGDMALTVELSEDNVTSSQAMYNSQTGGVTTTLGYTHNGVLRAYLTRPVGDRITVSGSRYSAHYTYTLPAAWKSDDITVGAFVTKAFDAVNADNMQMADVTNCNSVKLGCSTAVEGIAADGGASAADGIYTLDGVRVDSTAQLKGGIYIMRRNGKSCKIVK